MRLALVTPNRHPVDRLADVRREIRRLEQERDVLRAYVLDHPEDRVGDDYSAIPFTQQRRRLDLVALELEVGRDVIERCSNSLTVNQVRVRRRAENAITAAP
jgi:hypothetical protein